MERWRKRERDRKRKREAWGGRVGCGFDLGVLLEKGCTNTHNIQAQTLINTHAEIRTHAPCRAKYEADACCLVFLTSLAESSTRDVVTLVYI